MGSEDRRWARRPGAAARSLLYLGLALGLVSPRSTAHELDPPSDDPPTGGAQLSHVHCEDGFADVFPCLNMDLQAFVPRSVFATTSMSDLWGWADPVTGAEYGLVGMASGTAFVDVTNPDDPMIMGTLPAHDTDSSWRDIRVYDDHAFIVSESAAHGMQVFDLTRLRSVVTPPVVFAEDAHVALFGNAHNIAINEDTGYAYAVGSTVCSGGLIMMDVSVPTAPSQVGCFSADGYSHDATCVSYLGPDPDHQGSEICFASNTDTLTIVDVTDKANPVMLSRKSYLGQAYTHQGWLSEDHTHFFMDDELDERDLGHATRTYLWDVSDLDSPVFQGYHQHSTTAIDHNLFVMGQHLYQAQYRAGVRITRFGDLATPNMTEVAFLDTIPADDAVGFTGVWGVYPYLPSGIVLATDIYGGFFVMKPHLDAVPECGDGLDNDLDGAVDFPDDPGCYSLWSAREDPQCDDGIDNDGDGKIDWDGAPPDPQCTQPYGREAKGCGLGPELFVLLPPLLASRRSRRRGSWLRGRG